MLESVTRSKERDQLIMAQALYYGIKYIDSLPDWMQEKSNRHDMARMLKKLFPWYLGVHVLSEMGQKPDSLTDFEWAAVRKHRAVPEGLDNDDTQ